MFGIRILGVATAYSVVLLEIYSGAINGPQWWVYPGALVIALLLAISVFGVNPQAGQQAGETPRLPLAAAAVQWVIILGAACAMSFFANYFGREILPKLPAS